MPVEVWPQAELARTLSPGKELGRQGGTRPAALRLHPTPQGSAPCHLSQCLSAQDLKITFLKKKKKKKIHHPIEDTPPQHVWGDAGRSTCWIHGNTRNRKRGWFGPRLPGQGSRGFRCRHPPSRRPQSLVERAPLLCRQLSSAKAPDGRVQAGVGGKVVGKGTEVPEAPAPAAGRVRAAWSSLDRPCVCLSLSALLPREVHARCHLECVCGREGLRRWRAGRRAAGLPSPRGEEVQNAGTKKANTTGSQITRPSLPEFP